MQDDSVTLSVLEKKRSILTIKSCLKVLLCPSSLTCLLATLASAAARADLPRKTLWMETAAISADSRRWSSLTLRLASAAPMAALLRWAAWMCTAALFCAAWR